VSQNQDQPETSAPPAAEIDEIPRQSVFELIPRRSLIKAGVMLLVLLAIVFYKGRAANVIRQITDVVMPGGNAPAPDQVPARVRLAPVKGQQP
jgi:hypothetical protein